jgi:glycosyltransferase involved in cell wall biosynthesis
MPEFMAAADLCLLPARLNETMAHIVPAKIYEYLGAGKPVLASPLPGLKKEFGDGAGIRYVNGPQVLLDDAALLASNPELVSSLSADARRTARSQGSWNDVAARFLHVLSSAGDRPLPTMGLAQ